MRKKLLWPQKPHSGTSRVLQRSNDDVSKYRGSFHHYFCPRRLTICTHAHWYIFTSSILRSTYQTPTKNHQHPPQLQWWHQQRQGFFAALSLSYVWNFTHRASSILLLHLYKDWFTTSSILYNFNDDIIKDMCSLHLFLTHMSQILHAHRTIII